MTQSDVMSILYYFALGAGLAMIARVMIRLTTILEVFFQVLFVQWLEKQMQSKEWTADFWRKLL
jgi:hypothetical protein